MASPSSYPRGVITAKSVVEEALRNQRTDFTGYDIQGPYRNDKFNRQIGLEVVSPVLLKGLNLSNSRLSGRLDWKLDNCILHNTDMKEAQFPIDAAVDRRPYNLENLPKDLSRRVFDLLFKEQRMQQKQPKTLPFKEFVQELQQVGQGVASLLSPSLEQTKETVQGLQGLAKAFYSQTKKPKAIAAAATSSAGPTNYRDVVPQGIVKELEEKMAPQATRQEMAAKKVPEDSVKAQADALQASLLRIPHTQPHAARLHTQHKHLERAP